MIWQLLLKTYQPILKILIISIVIYGLIVIVWPLFWARLYSPTKPPISPGVIYNFPNPNQKSIFRAVVIGDSTALGQGSDDVKKSFGYQYLLTKLELKTQNWSFENRAVSGVKIAEVLDNQLGFEPVDLVMISIGANDITGLTKPEEFRKSVKMLIGRLKTLAKQVIWLNIPDFVTSPILLLPLNYILSQRELELNAILKNIVPKASYQLIDVYNEAREPFAKDPKLHFGVDGYHPSAAGYGVWVGVIQKNVKD